MIVQVPGDAPVGNVKLICDRLTPDTVTVEMLAGPRKNVWFVLSTSVMPTAAGVSKNASVRFSANTITPVFGLNGVLSQFSGLTTGNGSLRNNTESKAAA